MPDDKEIERKFWKALRSDMTVMLGAKGVDPRPMTAQMEEADHGPLWFFTSRQSELVKALPGNSEAYFSFTDKGHNVWAAVKGRLMLTRDRATIDRLWNPFVAAWFEQGKDDPDLALLRFDPATAEIWLDGSSILAGLRILMGSDPKEDYKDKVAKVSLV
ncbi:MAG: general stress protein [Cereibacter sphaeroides]|uniref:General stress protein n=1 Tax=Cereibacter sphaeroides TaxID=1063 RepID=A0A2W5U9Q3_CERSP|nr:MAG: general stress protein [Cereibacter sphaeroides]